MSIPSISSQISQSFGFHNEKSFTVEVYVLNATYSWSKETLRNLNLAGALPIVGHLVGVARITEAKRSWNDERSKDFKPFLVTQIVRGVLETLGLGILLLLVDVIVTAGRYFAERCGRSHVEVTSEYPDVSFN